MFDTIDDGKRLVFVGGSGTQPRDQNEETLREAQELDFCDALLWETCEAVRNMPGGGRKQKVDAFRKAAANATFEPTCVFWQRWYRPDGVKYCIRKTPCPKLEVIPGDPSPFAPSSALSAPTDLAQLNTVKGMENLYPLGELAADCVKAEGYQAYRVGDELSLSKRSMDSNPPSMSDLKSAFSDRFRLPPSDAKLGHISSVAERILSRGAVRARDAGWGHFSISEEAIYLALPTTVDDGMVARISKFGISRLPNGDNPERAFLSLGESVKPYPVINQNASGQHTWRGLLLRHLPCDRRLRSLVAAWIQTHAAALSIQTRAIMQFTGASAQGKSTASKMLVALATGRTLLSKGSPKSMIREANCMPLVNVDNCDVGGMGDDMLSFLLPSATGAGYAIAGSGRDTVRFESQGRILLNGIKLIRPDREDVQNRLLTIEMNRHLHGSEDFDETEILRELILLREPYDYDCQKAAEVYLKVATTPAFKSLKTVLRKALAAIGKDRLAEDFALYAVVADIEAWRGGLMWLPPNSTLVMVRSWMEALGQSANRSRRLSVVSRGTALAVHAPVVPDLADVIKEMLDAHLKANKLSAIGHAMGHENLTATQLCKLVKDFVDSDRRLSFNPPNPQSLGQQLKGLGNDLLGRGVTIRIQHYGGSKRYTLVIPTPDIPKVQDDHVGNEDDGSDTTASTGTNG